MHIPQTTPVTSFAPTLTGLDAGLHSFVGVSWHILMPYTFLGAGLMIYSQTRLLRGQRALSQQTPKVIKERKKSPKRLRFGWISSPRLASAESTN